MDTKHCQHRYLLLNLTSNIIFKTVFNLHKNLFLNRPSKAKSCFIFDRSSLCLLVMQ